MAKTANADDLKMDVNGPDFEGALAQIKSIMGTDQKVRTINGQKTANWKAIDNFRVDRAAARIVKSVLQLESDNRTMTLRSLFGLLIAAKDEIDLPGDLVDMMHKAIPTGLHVETPGTVRPKPRSVPKADSADSKVVALRQKKKEEGEPISNDIGAPAADGEDEGSAAPVGIDEDQDDPNLTPPAPDEASDPTDADS